LSLNGGASEPAAISSGSSSLTRRRRGRRIFAAVLTTGPLALRREIAMMKRLATYALVLGAAGASAFANADPYICVGAMTDVEVLFHVRHDAYFSRKPLHGKTLRIEYAGCGYHVYVGGKSPGARHGDMLLVDRYGHVTGVVHRR
jgi:hypothetical protein